MGILSRLFGAKKEESFEPMTDPQRDYLYDLVDGLTKNEIHKRYGVSKSLSKHEMVLTVLHGKSKTEASKLITELAAEIRAGKE